jgi:DNA polymerase-3 subunit delta
MQLSPQAIQLLVANYGSNLWALSNELDKLANYATGRRIEEEDVRTLMAAAEINVFALVDAVVEGRESAALQFVRWLTAAGMESPHLLALIIRQYRMLLLAKDGQEAGVSSQEMGRRLGTTSDFLLNKVTEQSSRYTQSQLRQAYKRLLEADLAIKRGRQEEELALEILIADLIRQRRREPSRRSA